MGNPNYFGATKSLFHEEVDLDGACQPPCEDTVYQSKNEHAKYIKVVQYQQISVSLNVILTWP
jgi:hypothetical protein